MPQDDNETRPSLEGVAGLVDTLAQLRADLAEEDAELHAQRIAVIDETLATFREQGGR